MVSKSDVIRPDIELPFSQTQNSTQDITEDSIYWTNTPIKTLPGTLLTGLTP
jgi:hypothetical protein